jgi:hypothetical protein
MTIEVWYQLRFGDDLQGCCAAVYLEASNDIVDLTDAIKKEWGNYLPCAAADLIVFLADGDPKSEPIDPGEDIPTGTTSKKPLIVVAPAPPQQQEQPIDGKSRVVLVYNARTSIFGNAQPTESAATRG